MDRSNAFLDATTQFIWFLCGKINQIPLPILVLLTLNGVLSLYVLIYVTLFILAPLPRAPLPSEKTYITTTPGGDTTAPNPLPCWYDSWLADHKEAGESGKPAIKHDEKIEDADLMMSVVVPAYNEENRLQGMLEEAVEYLDTEYGRITKGKSKAKFNAHTTGAAKKINGKGPQQRASKANGHSPPLRGYEIILVDDGSKDNTVDVALRFSKKHQLHEILRIVSLKENRGKGGAVTHGFRHVRGQYVIFADADGASTFSDISKLVQGCQEVQDKSHRGIAVGSRAHMVGSEAVIKRSVIRNALMHSFHFLLRLLTPAATSRIRDTQCGFKLFTRASLPHIIPYMHAEGWIFDVEMLMLAESAPREPRASHSTPGIRVKEVAIGWKEVGGSKLNVLRDSIIMAWGLAVLRLSWMMGIYRRRW